MKRSVLALLVSCFALANAAFADRISINGSVRFGPPHYGPPAPIYRGVPPPAYCPPPPPPRGYWTTVAREYWVPGRWVETRNSWGHTVRFWEAPHREVRHERVWVDGFARHPGRGHGGHWNG